ncbi:MAG: dihydrodipicolinate synthase family protein [Thermodesulfobacteriota bacterium]|nr:dihydrodipicolinate synthase family protein [Thermodesulfobacteriota bacterium]
MSSEIKQMFLERVKGPVFPIPTPFNREGQVNFRKIREYVDFLLQEGARTLMVTVGAARFAVLTIEEMKKVNETVVDSASGKAFTIVTTPDSGSTQQAIEFARHAEEIGADGILAVFPDRYYTEDGVYRFFEDISRSCSIGVLVHAMPIRAGRETLGPKINYSPELIERLAGIDNMVGTKEESGDKALEYKYNRLFQGRFLIIGSAGMRAFLSDYQWGQQAYIVSIGNVAPEIELGFYSALANGDYEKARQIVFEKEERFLDGGIDVGWHLGLKEALECAGLMEAWERKPIERLDAEGKKKIESIITELNLKNANHVSL